MDEVGVFLNGKPLIVAEVPSQPKLWKPGRSLEPFMEKTESSMRGKSPLATVTGTVQRYRKKSCRNHPGQSRFSGGHLASGPARTLIKAGA